MRRNLIVLVVIGLVVVLNAKICFARGSEQKPIATEDEEPRTLKEAVLTKEELKLSKQEQIKVLEIKIKEREQEGATQRVQIQEDIRRVEAQLLKVKVGSGEEADLGMELETLHFMGQDLEQIEEIETQGYREVIDILNE